MNKILAIAASQICMPPVVPAICIEVGYFLRFGRFITFSDFSSLSDVSFVQIGYFGLQRFAEWFLGSLIIGPLLAIIVSVVLFLLSINLQKTILWSQNRKS